MKCRSSLLLIARSTGLVLVVATLGRSDARERATQPSFAPVLSSMGSVVSDTNARTLHVGPTAEFTTPSAAAAVARDGDTVEIASGDYRGDAAVWTANRLRIVGATPRPHIRADGREVQGKGLWLIRGDDTVVENVELSGTRVPDRNGAAIRLEARNFVLRNSYLHDNENGLLTGANATSEITIDHCEFARNGGGEGMTHNLYVGQVAKLTVTNSYLHHAVVGHNLKSRALVTMLSDNRLADESDGRASYEADFPNGGRVTLAFNIFQKGSAAENPTLVSYGAEGLAAAARTTSSPRATRSSANDPTARASCSSRRRPRPPSTATSSPGRARFPKSPRSRPTTRCNGTCRATSTCDRRASESRLAAQIVDFATHDDAWAVARIFSDAPVGWFDSRLGRISTTRFFLCICKELWAWRALC